MYHFILNPKSSNGNAVNIWKKLEKILKEEQTEYKLHILRGAKETTAFVEELTNKERFNLAESEELYNEEYCHIVVLGGDGTLHAVLNGIFDFEHTIISCIRTGSGNDFARNIGVNKNPEQALRHLLHFPEQVKLDYGIAYYESETLQKEQRFIISSGIGYDADICEEVSRSKLKMILNKFGLGRLVYLVIGIKQIFLRNNTPVNIYIDDLKPKRINDLFCAIGMIHEKEGGGVPFCPNANPTDGFLDVCFVKEMPKWKLLLTILMVYAKQHHRWKDVMIQRCRRVEVVPDQIQWFHMDGEVPHQIKRLVLQCQSGFNFCK